MAKTIRPITTDEALLASVRAAVSGLAGYELGEAQTVEDVLERGVGPDDVLLIDAWQRAENVYESCRRLTGRVRCRVLVVTDPDNRYAEPIALFCGATGVVPRPVTARSLRQVLERSTPRRGVPADERREAPPERELPEALLKALVGERSNRLVDVLIDPETGLYRYDYLKFKLDEEWKRAQRFDLPLSCVMLGFDGEASQETLARLASIFLNASRDTDVLGRFDESSFLFFLPNTGPDGAEVMARRIREAAEAAELSDLLGDALEISVGIASCPHPEVRKREDLFARARSAFLAGQRDGGLVVRADGAG